MINPYDHCVANKIIKGKQCMVLWNVDNLKISLVDKYIVEGIIKFLGMKFGRESPLVMARAKC